MRRWPAHFEEHPNTSPSRAACTTITAPHHTPLGPDLADATVHLEVACALPLEKRNTAPQ